MRLRERLIQFRRNSGQWPNQPFELLPWQSFVIGSLFGWKRADVASVLDGRR
ncbi:MAG: hypothetical protein JWL84_4797 [Rhodospirillales bacterium]|jgi:phage terminase large subunit-like protein|nr:hypothetical protein [Rhodospirillales bacterium]